jgi:hypothetical protein
VGSGSTVDPRTAVSAAEGLTIGAIVAAGGTLARGAIVESAAIVDAPRNVDPGTFVSTGKIVNCGGIVDSGKIIVSIRTVDLANSVLGITPETPASDVDVTRLDRRVDDTLKMEVLTNRNNPDGLNRLDSSI